MMGSSGSGAADFTVGSIVWVRRRNGSWWPGKILSQKDLDYSTLINSPRSGTPVKLLGREDASVEWYNFEISKRVRPFRCGDFDECIEKVETSQGVSIIRKREKYARREDAIHHALELEKELLNKEVNTVDAATKEEVQPSCEDMALPRMRGLQGFGIRTASLKRKASSSNGHDTSFKNLARSNSSASSSGDHSMERPSYTFRKDNITRNVMEAKRSRYMFTPNESSNVLEDLHETLLSHGKPMHSSCAGGDSRYSLSEYDPPEFLEDIEFDASESDTDTEEDTDDDIPSLSGARRLSERHNSFSRQMSAEDESTSSGEEDHYESSISGDSSYLYFNSPDNVAGAVSKWHLIGSRNKHNLPRKSSRKRDMHRYHMEDRRYSEYKRRAFGQKPMCYESDYMTDDTGYDDYPLSTMVASVYKNIYSHDLLDWDGDDPWEGKIGVKKEEKLEALGNKEFDVDLEVRGSYKKGRVPFVSLMSKLNGRAIIGHPVEIEVLAYGSSESYVQTMDCFGNETAYHDKDKPFLLPSAWKTSRRSNSRVARQPLGERKQQQKKKSMKNTNATTSQKTRALSSFSSEQGHNALRDRTHELSNGRVLLGSPTVACIPVKLVFSRLLEKINRPPSKSTTKAFKERRITTRAAILKS